MTLQEIIAFAEKMDERDINRLREMLTKYSAETVKSAVAALSYNELMAVKAIFADKQIEKVYSAKEIATKNGITRSILVTAVDKLACAGLVTQKALGCKGCRVKVLNTGLFEVLEGV